MYPEKSIVDINKMILGFHFIIIVMRVSTMDLPEEYSEGIPYGMNLRFSFKVQMLHLFDSDSEESLLWR